MCLKSVLVSHFLCLRKKKLHSHIYHSGDINEKYTLHFIQFTVISSIQFKSHLFKAIQQTQALELPGSDWKTPVPSVLKIGRLTLRTLSVLSDRTRCHAAAFNLFGWHLQRSWRLCNLLATGWEEPKRDE